MVRVDSNDNNGRQWRQRALLCNGARWWLGACLWLWQTTAIGGHGCRLARWASASSSLSPTFSFLPFLLWKWPQNDPSSWKNDNVGLGLLSSCENKNGPLLLEKHWLSCKNVPSPKSLPCKVNLVQYRWCWGEVSTYKQQGTMMQSCYCCDVGWCKCWCCEESCIAASPLTLSPHKIFFLAPLSMVGSPFVKMPFFSTKRRNYWLLQLYRQEEKMRSSLFAREKHPSKLNGL